MMVPDALRHARFDVLILITPLPVILYVSFRHALGRVQDQISHLSKVNRVYVGAIEALAHAVDAKDEVTHDHTRRVQDRAVHLARALGVDDEGEIQAIKAASLLHDVGKLAIPEHILNKPGRLTPAEYEIMKRHAPIGADILSVIGFPYAVAPIVRHHHENWDGTGYPDGLAGDRIPRGSRIIAVVDCFDALTSDRPCPRPHLDGGSRNALQILSDRRGTMYDPQVVDTFFALHGHGMVTAYGQPSHPRPAATMPRARPGAGARRAVEGRTRTLIFRPSSNWAGRSVLESTLPLPPWRDTVDSSAERICRPPLFVLYGYDRGERFDRGTVYEVAGEEVRQ